MSVPRKPVYPRAMEGAGVSGQVTLLFVVDTLGRCEPTSLHVVDSSHPAFEQSTLQAVLGTLFRPTRARGNPVRLRGR